MDTAGSMARRHRIMVAKKVTYIGEIQGKFTEDAEGRMIERLKGLTKSAREKGEVSQDLGHRDAFLLLAASNWISFENGHATDKPKAVTGKATPKKAPKVFDLSHFDKRNKGRNKTHAWQAKSAFCNQWVPTLVKLSRLFFGYDIRPHLPMEEVIWKTEKGAPRYIKRVTDQEIEAIDVLSAKARKAQIMTVEKRPLHFNSKNYTDGFEELYVNEDGFYIDVMSRYLEQGCKTFQGFTYYLKDMESVGIIKLYRYNYKALDKAKFVASFGTKETRDGKLKPWVCKKNIYERMFKCNFWTKGYKQSVKHYKEKPKKYRTIDHTEIDNILMDRKTDRQAKGK
jgi:hypothetical protein